MSDVISQFREEIGEVLMNFVEEIYDNEVLLSFHDVFESESSKKNIIVYKIESEKPLKTYLLSYNLENYFDEKDLKDILLNIRFDYDSVKIRYLIYIEKGVI